MTSAGDPMYAIQDVAGKGKGLLATRNIAMGTRILSEEPVIRFREMAFSTDTPALRKSIRKQVDTLTHGQRQAFLSMHNIYDDDDATRPLGIIRTNGLPFGDDEGGIFLEACRINHACDNNAQKSWNETIKRHTVHAMRDIEEGEEITITYLGVLNKRDIRQEKLRQKFAFKCVCGLCALPPAASQEIDRILEEIINLDNLIGQNGAMAIMTAPARMLLNVDQQIQLYNKQGPNDSGLPRAYFDAAQIFIANGDLARGRILAKRATEGWTILGGGDCPIVLQHSIYAQDPKKFQLYGMSMKWKTGIDDVPEGLSTDEFEDWLWKRPKPQRPGQLANLRNKDVFPGWDDLPDEHNPPRGQHWVYLAEIMDVDSLIRLQMRIKDVEGNEVPLFFHTEEGFRGRTKFPLNFEA